jgi:hypothetical protein
MKALSLRQPFAELVLIGRKTIETRTWNTTYRGKFLIHAAAKSNDEKMEEYGFTELPTGCIVGEAEIVDVKVYHDLETWNADVEKHCFPLTEWTKTRYGFLLENVKRLKLKPYKGALNFFYVR